MRRCVVWTLVSTLIISLAAPAGAVFAYDGAAPPEVMEVTASVEATEVSEVAAVEAVSPAVPTISTESESAAPETMEELDAREVDSVNPEVPESPKGVAASTQSEPVVVAPEVVLPASPILITAYKADGAHVHAIQLYNNTSSRLSLKGYELSYLAGEDEYSIELADGWLEPRSYMVIGWSGESEFADMEFSFSGLNPGKLSLIELRHKDYQPNTVVVPVNYGGELLHRYKSGSGNYTTNTAFSTGSSTISGGGLYVLPDRPDVSVLEILVNPRDCVYGDESADCYDYIKIRNDGADTLDLGLYRLRSGYSNTNSTASNTAYFNDILAPGEVKTLAHGGDGSRVSFTANDGTVWLEDVYGYVAFDLAVPPYAGSSLAAQTGRSWAYNDKTEQWQWATPSPGKEVNDFTQPELKTTTPQTRQLAPCRDDQYRSEQTNRCRSITPARTLTPCREGQYRSEETNRCRSIATAAASVLKPCADDQFRNPLTNRCKKIASAEDVSLADCGEGRERNPATNRCRNILASTMPTAPFAPDEITHTAQGTIGWWAFGGVSLVALGYAGWQWRFEAGRLIRRISQAFVSSSKE